MCTHIDIGYISKEVVVSREPRAEQKRIIKKIVKDFDKRKTSIVLLYGDPGKGKSMIPRLLCRHFVECKKSCSFIKSFNPTDFGDNFSSMYSTVDPSHEQPLVVVLEEIDIILARIHYGLRESNKFDTQVKDKISWNDFLDDFDNGDYPGVILVMTTNKHPTFFDALDSSYLREGRVNLKIHVD